ncbi:MAG: hypothetical protein F6J90_34235 [Moorea sp. SIOASIH]|uniref:hypothetical protein n=1 Tax=Moorena sp. SIOASIH TaxID=2607817 RepID=UPI0013B5D28D|nr:hypothetical protein [Moorena sp. SIOASIH]NEO41111.1 hypothetical protein [Moorena sp. SIOASIH]NEO93720.1 hypothetical protein [Moorena sp. SIO3G5]
MSRQRSAVSGQRSALAYGHATRMAHATSGAVSLFYYSKAAIALRARCANSSVPIAHKHLQ